MSPEPYMPFWLFVLVSAAMGLALAAVMLLWALARAG